MTEKYFNYVRMFVAGFAAIGMIIVFAGVVSDLSKSDTNVGSKLNQPNVKFSDYKEFHNSLPIEITVVSDTQGTNEEDEFRSAFFQHYQVIFKNMSEYSSALGQDNIDDDELEEYLFNLVSQYNTQLRVVYLEQLDSESKALLEYAKEVTQNRDAKVILWSDFLDWFSADFKDQSQNLDIPEVEEKMFLTTEVFIIFILLLIILLLTKFDIKSIDSEEKIKEDEIKEEK